MTTTVPALDRQKGTVPTEALLGRILWYSVPTATCLDPKIVAELTDLGFTRKIPTIPSESDVFRRVTVRAERKNIPVEDTDQSENWLLRVVNARNENTLTRRLVVEHVDPSGRLVRQEDGLDYKQILDIDFEIDTSVSPNKGVIKVHWINGFSPTTHPRAQLIVDEIRAEFDRWKGQFHDAIMRHWIKQTILGFGATSVRPTGGIYFLKEEFASQVEALETFITNHFPPGGECNSVEIPDTKKQREMVRRAIEAETTGAIEAMMVEVNEIKASGKLTAKQHVAMLARVKKLDAKMDDYSALLETDLSAVRTRSRLLHGMVSGLASVREGN